MYVPSDYDDYNYLVSLSDNYAVLTNRHVVNGSWESPIELSVIYQYFLPSNVTVPSRININSTRTFQEIEITDNFYSRGDCPQLICTILMLVFFILFIINGLTFLVKRGGIFFGS